MTRTHRYIHIDPTARSIATTYASDPYAALQSIDKRDTDHGGVEDGVAIIVWEYGLLDGDGPYFSVNGQLYAGHAILYAYDGHGDTVDMPEGWARPVYWYADKAEVEAAIEAGKVVRPVAKINGVVTWTWK